MKNQSGFSLFFSLFSRKKWYFLIIRPWLDNGAVNNRLDKLAFSFLRMVLILDLTCVWRNAAPFSVRKDSHHCRIWHELGSIFIMLWWYGIYGNKKRRRPVTCKHESFLRFRFCNVWAYDQKKRNMLSKSEKCVVVFSRRFFSNWWVRILPIIYACQKYDMIF